MDFLPHHLPLRERRGYLHTSVFAICKVTGNILFFIIDSLQIFITALDNTFI